MSSLITTDLTLFSQALSITQRTLFYLLLFLRLSLIHPWHAVFSILSKLLLFADMAAYLDNENQIAVIR